MSHTWRSGATAFDRLTSHYNDVDLTCPSCGYEDDDGHWKAETSGDRVLYRHICPSCGSIRRRTITLRN